MEIGEFMPRPWTQRGSLRRYLFESGRPGVLPKRQNRQDNRGVCAILHLGKVYFARLNAMITDGGWAEG